MWAEKIIALGVNHKTAPVEIREKLTFADGPKEPLLQLRRIPGCEECCFLSTCNRVEVIFVSDQPDITVAGIREFLFARSRLSEQEIEKYTYLHNGPEAITHLFMVASSLDSMVVGEPQILGQLKDAYREAAAQKTTGVILNRLLHKAFSVAKRIRSETNIGGSAVSISYAAVELAKKIFGSLSSKKVMLVGAGEMAELAAEHLVNQGIAEVVVANRTFERAVNLARCFNGTPVSLSELVQQLEVVDIMISSTGASGLVLLKDEVKPIMRRRRNRPLFLIDIAVPRDLDPKLNEVDNVYLYDIDDLKNVVDINKTEREKEAVKAERIVAEESLNFQGWMQGMEITPTIVAIREKAEKIRQAELGKTLRNFGDLSEKERKSLDKLTSAIVNKLLHDPYLFLKSNGAGQEQQVKLELVRKLFGLD